MNEVKPRRLSVHDITVRGQEEEREGVGGGSPPSAPSVMTHFFDYCL